MKNTFRNIAVMSIGLTLIGLNACQEEINLEKELPNTYILQNLPETGVIEGSYIVIYNSDFVNKSTALKSAKTFNEKNSLMRNTTNEVIAEHQIKEENIVNVYSDVTYGFSGFLEKHEIEKLKKDPRVARIEKDSYGVLAPTKGKGNGNGGGDTPPAAGQVIPWGIQRVGGPVDGTGKTAWILDSGIDLDHPDLNVDATRSRSFIPKGKDSNSANDGAGHGTHVAGIIGALDNDFGVVGVAPNTTVVAIKVCNSKGQCAASDIIAGIDYVISQAQPGDVANMSFALAPSAILDNAVINLANQGIFCSIGNGDNVSPGRISGVANVYSISAIYEGDYWEGFGAGENADYAAPGGLIYSTFMGNSYKELSGTSMAIPHAAGVLLMTGGVPNIDGYNIGDPDSPDPIIHL